MRVLLVEDEGRIATDVARSLAAAGYVVEMVGDGEEAWFRGETDDYDAIVLDLGLPKLDGLSVLKRWRAAGMAAPVLILTARGAWMERVEGIDAGADDYLGKPFHVEELVARVGALVRRSAGHTTPLLEVGALRVDTRRMTVLLRGSVVALSPLEYRLLRYLIHHQGRAVSQGELAEHVYGNEQEPDSNALEVLVGRLRRKIGADYIATRRGYGYLIEAQS